MFEKANTRRGTTHRSVKLPGKSAFTTDRDAKSIARELRAKSKLGKLEAAIAKAEAADGN